MKAKISQWGNSLGVRIPTAIAEDVGLYAGAEVQLVKSGNTVRMEPLQPQSYRLADLLQRITPASLHGETASGPARGAEIIE